MKTAIWVSVDDGDSVDLPVDGWESIREALDIFAETFDGIRATLVASRHIAYLEAYENDRCVRMDINIGSPSQTDPEAWSHLVADMIDAGVI